jgi:hypothetical protein
VTVLFQDLSRRALVAYDTDKGTEKELQMSWDLLGPIGLMVAAVGLVVLMSLRMKGGG